MYSKRNVLTIVVVLASTVGLLACSSEGSGGGADTSSVDTSSVDPADTGEIDEDVSEPPSGNDADSGPPEEFFGEGGTVSMLNADPARTGRHPGPGVETLGGQKWAVPTGSLSSTSTVATDGVVFVGSDGPAQGSNGLFAIDAASGQIERRILEGDAVRGTPTVVDGTVYFGSGGTLVAVDPDTKEVKWRYPTSGKVTTAPAVVDGGVYAASNQGPDSYAFAVDAETGEEKWTYEAPQAVSSPAVADGVVYFGTSEQGTLHAVDAETGQQNWVYEIEGRPAAENSMPTVAGGTVYIYFGSPFDGTGFKLHAIDVQTGDEKWTFDTTSAVGPPAVADGVVYIGNGDSHLYALNAENGDQKWRFETGASVGSSPSVVDGTVYFGSQDNHLYAVDTETGEEQWSHAVGGEVRSSPAVVDGAVYFSSSDGSVYALESGQ